MWDVTEMGVMGWWYVVVGGGEMRGERRRGGGVGGWIGRRGDRAHRGVLQSHMSGGSPLTLLDIHDIINN